MPSTVAYAKKGSQRWLQLAVNQAPRILDQPLAAAAKLPAGAVIEWLSPLEREGFVEYRDESVLDCLGVSCEKRALAEFWPQRGPMWDGLARASTGDVFLVEAKAHIGEILSGGTRASEIPKAKIVESLTAVRDKIARGSDTDWSGTFYQYANRLAHLHFLREENGIQAHLVFVYFLNDAEMGGPSERAAYEGAIHLVEGYLGVRQSKISKYIHKLFIDVREIEAALASRVASLTEKASRAQGKA